MFQNDNEILTGKFGSSGRKKLQGLVVKLLPNDVHQIVMEVAGNPSSVLSTVAAILKNEGEVLDVANGDDIPAPESMRLKAIIGSGLLNMNPAIVTIDIQQLPPNQTRITIQGVAKEGLIKQHAGEKAARFIARRISEVVN